jgi:2-polyprenyl-3-methyl-5-hydroxy-6-metoxy-1,4-benzoquinol methylase
MTTCWCGNNDLAPFSAAYGECGECGTLVSLQGMSPEELQVRDDESDFYGKQYWLGHQSADLGFPDIHTRARADLTERNLHWLKALLKYKLPPASVMEIGCSHGSFVGLLQLAGYEAQGVELSPWVVDFGRRAFGVPISVGPVENLAIAKGSLDAIALMDVLEHLPDPVATMAYCLELLKPDGLLLIQTPQFREGMRYADLEETKGAFLEQLKADEHLYLLSDRAARRLFNQLGTPHLCFEPAIFSQYDMFFTVSRQLLHARGDDETEAALLSSPGGRMALALLDMRRHAGKLDSAIAELTQYKTSADEQVRTLTDWLLESRAANESLIRQQSDLGGQIESLNAMLLESRAENESLTRLLSPRIQGAGK